MFVEMMVPCCDISDKTYPKPVKGAGALAQGATGRWCVVMYFGPEYLKDRGIEPMSYDAAVEACMVRGGKIDF